MIDFPLSWMSNHFLLIFPKLDEFFFFFYFAKSSSKEYILALLSQLVLFLGLLSSVVLEFYGFFLLSQKTSLILLLQFVFSSPSVCLS